MATMTKQDWRDLAEARLIDADVLLQNQRWAAAYYIAGYAVECDQSSARWSDEMDKRPLVGEQIDAGATFLSEFEKYVPVTVAFWYRSDDDTSPALWVASHDINDENFDIAYGEVIRIAAAMRNPNFEGGDVKVVNSDDRLAKASLELMQRYGGTIPAHYHSRRVGESWSERSTFIRYRWRPHEPTDSRQRRPVLRLLSFVANGLERHADGTQRQRHRYPHLQPRRVSKIHNPGQGVVERKPGPFEQKARSPVRRFYHRLPACHPRGAGMFRANPPE